MNGPYIVFGGMFVIAIGLAIWGLVVYWLERRR
jgi:hypothetical protein